MTVRPEDEIRRRIEVFEENIKDAIRNKQNYEWISDWHAKVKILKWVVMEK